MSLTLRRVFGVGVVVVVGLVRFAGHDRDKVAYFRLVMNIKDIK